MRSPGERALPQHRAPSAAARVRACAARVLGRAAREGSGADEVPPDPDGGLADAAGTLPGQDGGLAGARGGQTSPDDTPADMGGRPGGPDDVLLGVGGLASLDGWLRDAGRAPDRPPEGRARRGGPRRARSSSRGRRISLALRRLVVTPTFAAGLGVVVAAFLAANMSRTVLHFSAPIPGNQCSAGDCRPPEPHGGTLASARPGVRIKPRVPVASVPVTSGPITAIQPGGGQPDGSEPGGSRPRGSKSGGSQPGSHHPGGSQQGGPGPAAGNSGGPQPSVGSRAFSVTYQQVEQWPGGFADQITIRGLSGSRAQAWSLALAYPGARIAGVQGARWEPGRAGAGVAQGMSWGGWGQAHRSAVPVRLTVTVEGRPAAPSGCTFDGQLCTFGSPATS
jgi:Cellulose binding domain